jgi:hypothetical protein
MSVAGKATVAVDAVAAAAGAGGCYTAAVVNGNQTELTLCTPS